MPLDRGQDSSFYRPLASRLRASEYVLDEIDGSPFIKGSLCRSSVSVEQDPRQISVLDKIHINAKSLLTWNCYSDVQTSKRVSTV